MSVNRTRTSVAYGLTNSLQNLAPEPITANRSPQVGDLAEVNTLWTNGVANSTYILSDVTAGQAIWNPIAGASLTLAGGVGIYSGSGAPSFAAAKGSLYLNTAGSSTSTRLYVCSVSSGTWVAVTTAS